jgi:hypothetical protein
MSFSSQRPLPERLATWQTMRSVNEIERQRLAILNSPPVKNPPELMRQMRVRVLKPFCVLGARVEPGAIVDLARHDVLSLMALGKVEIL